MDGGYPFEAPLPNARGLVKAGVSVTAVKVSYSFTGKCSNVLGGAGRRTGDLAGTN